MIFYKNKKLIISNLLSIIYLANSIKFHIINIKNAEEYVLFIFYKKKKTFFLFLIMFKSYFRYLFVDRFV